MNHNLPNDDQYITTFFCRALYDYQSRDASSLSFQKEEIIEVLTRLESGWWDGLLGDERGWFPSNYVQVISDEEAEAVLSGSEYSTQPQDDIQDAIVDLSHVMTRDHSISETDREWLHEEEASRLRNGIADIPSVPVRDMTQANDFWMPQVTQDGQIYYVNTQTGQRSRDLPRESDDDTSDDDLAGLTAAQSSSRAGPSAGLGLSSISTPEKTGRIQDPANNAGFGVLKRSGTPEPWVKRLADDGKSYYYWNKLNNQVSWSFPDVEDSKGRNRIPETTRQNPVVTASYEGRPADHIIAGPSRLWTEPSSHNRRRNESLTDHVGMSSDNSDVQPLGNGHSSPPLPLMNGHNGFHWQDPTPKPVQDVKDTVDLTPAERLAKSLQQALTPPPPELVADLAVVARDAIGSVVESIRLNGFPRRPEEDKSMDDLVRAVVLAVRNLLYVSAAPSGHIPGNLFPRDAPDSRVISASQTLLKPAQRKVTATLSKLVLSARAMQYDSVTPSNDNPNRIEGDAEELERAVTAFVVEVQRCQSDMVTQQLHERSAYKRLRGVFATSNVGLGLVGAGFAGSWKGFGWVAAHDNDETPSRVLVQEVVAEVRSYRLLVEENFAILATALRQTDSEQVLIASANVIAHLSTFLTFVGNIHIARHVDIDGVSQESGHLSSEDAYTQTVAKARLLVRTLEVATQSLYDDGASLFLATQAVRLLGSGQHLSDQAATYDYLSALATSLKANLGVVQQTLEALSSAGRDQAEMSHNEYHGSIEWRMSRLSIIEGRHNRLHSVSYLDPESEDIVNLEDAFSAPGATKLQHSLDSFERPSVYQQSSQSPDLSRSISSHISSTLAMASGNTENSVDTLVPSSSVGLLEDFDDESTSLNRPRAKDLTKILGDDAPERVLNRDQKPWYLRPTYSHTEILIEPDGAIRGGTVPALIERLTAHETGDPTFIKTFLMTYKSFTNLDELFNLLVQRFWIRPPEGLSSQELDEWGKLKQHVIQMRVLNTFRSMVVDDDILEKEDYYILDRMKEFVSKEEVIHLAAAKQLLSLIDRAQRSGDAKVKTLITTTHQVPPSTILPKNLKKLKILDIDPLELARQLTIMESNLYQKIRPMECLQRSREQRVGDNNDNIAQIIQTSNRIANWVADSVLAKEDSRRRAMIVKQFINVADRCRGLHNYSSMVAIVSGLNSTPIRRLKRTWDLVNARLMSQLSACEVTIDTNKNFNNYRSTLARITPPCVPFIGVFLTTLTFIQDGSKDNLPGNLVNFRKRQKASEVIQDIKRWQSIPYNFRPVPTILAYIEESLNQFQDQVSIGDQLWNLSLEREPREREDEKMARLLQESGFL